MLQHLKAEMSDIHDNLTKVENESSHIAVGPGRGTNVGLLK